MSILTKGLEHEKHMLHLSSTFDYNDIFDQVSNPRSGQNGQMSIKMAILNGYGLIKLTILI
jgi:hypothetical protein